MNIKKILFVFIFLLSPTARADILEQNFSADSATFNDFRTSLEKSNVVYIGECHRRKPTDRDATEVFRIGLTPELISLGFNTFYLEDLPYFNAPIFKEYYQDLYSDDQNARKTVQDRIIEMTKYGANAETYANLIKDLLKNNISLYGYGLTFNEMNDDQLSIQKKLIMATNRAVGSVAYELLDPNKKLKTVLYGGALHNDRSTIEKSSEDLIAGERIKQLDPKISYLSIDIIPLQYLTKKLSDKATDDQRLYDGLMKLNYLSLLIGKEQKAKSTKQPMLIEVQDNQAAKAYADYVIFVP